MIRPTDTLGEAAQKALAPNFARMVAHEAGTCSGEDCEDLHAMRVATRRMRTFLQIAGPYLDMVALRPICKGLRQTAETLGTVRDMDVFRQKTEAYLEAYPANPDDFAPLTRAWNVAYTQRRNALLDDLNGKRYAGFRARLEQQLAQPLPEATPPMLVIAVVPALITERLSIALKAGAQVGQPDTTLVAYHELRIELKRLRYTLEFFSDTFSASAAQAVEAIKSLQDDLGDLQDAVVAVAHLRAAMAFGTWDPPEQPRTLWHADDRRSRDGLQTYLESREAEIDRWLTGIPTSWQRFRDAGHPERIQDAAMSLTAASATVD